jgi:hypothetical protein
MAKHVATNHVEAWWLEFSTAVMPPDAPADQHREMRRAFYAGVWAMLTAQLHIIGHPDVSEDQGEGLLQSWYDECEQFKQDVLEGRA